MNRSPSMSTLPTPPTLDLEVEGMTCASCVRRVETALGKVPGVAQASVNLATRRAHVTLSAEGADPGALVAAVEKRGYQARLISRESPAAGGEAEEDAVAGRRFLLALALTLPVFLIEMGGHLIPALHHAIHSRIDPQRSEERRVGKEGRSRRTQAGGEAKDTR